MDSHAVREDKGSPRHPIRPQFIISKGKIWEAFDNNETEASALWLVRFCQSRLMWPSFTLAEIEKFYCDNSQFWNFSFNRLIEQGYVIQDGDSYAVTHEFICRCFQYAPVESMFAPQQSAAA